MSFLLNDQVLLAQGWIMLVSLISWEHASTIRSILLSNTEENGQCNIVEYLMEWDRSMELRILMGYWTNS